MRICAFPNPTPTWPNSAPDIPLPKAAPAPHPGPTSNQEWGASLDWAWFEAGESIEFTLALPGTPRWTGRYEADGSIYCEFRQAALWLPCTMRDVSAHPASTRAIASEAARPALER